MTQLLMVISMAQVWKVSFQLHMHTKNNENDSYLNAMN